MRIPKYRAWLKEDKLLVPVESISFIGNSIETTFRPNPNITKVKQEIELMESTGLFDKNNKEIFEGDIVKYKIGRNTFIEPVVYSKDYTGFGLRDEDCYGGIIFSFKEIAEDVDLKSLEVIGNIWEDSELLGK
jgi:uncharacterized phage protein (TIGR01671 family)